MLKYFQWLSIAGVWGSLLLIAGCFALTGIISFSGPSGSAWGLAISGMILVIAAAHALAISSLVGLALLAIGKARTVPATAVSAFAGGSLSTFMLWRIYFHIGP
jgi:low temperature requirement protein LtrA